MTEYFEAESPIADLQGYLRMASRIYPTLPEIAVDGIYGAQTTAAVKEFQRLNDRALTGEVDYDTWELMRLTANAIRMLDSEPIRGVDFPPELLVGMQSEQEQAYYVSIMLNRIAEGFENITDVELGAGYDSNTRDAVTELQRAAGLEPTGITDKRTWNLMSDVYTAYR